MTQSPPAETTYITKVGDTLWAIAEHFYGDGNFWQSIYVINKQVIGHDPNLLVPELVLTISPTYVTQKGDTLQSIATAFYGSAREVNVQAIYNANQWQIGPNPDLLPVGLRLVIPPSPRGPVGFPYTTRYGDNLYNLAQRFYGNGNRWPDIYNANRDAIGPDPNNLPVGIVLNIPS